MSSASSTKTVTLKRTVTIKAVVTEKFKEYMLFELEDAVKKTNQRIAEIDQQIKILGKPDSEAKREIHLQLEAEKEKSRLALQELPMRIDEAKKLALNSYFVQGMIDGFVSVKEGDNLYEKLGAMEIIIKDGVIQYINSSTSASLQ
ncbi:MAG: YlqD family protein [Candidatus Margulisiibacteriota bacterium]